MTRWLWLVLYSALLLTTGCKQNELDNERLQTYTSIISRFLSNVLGHTENLFLHGTSADPLICKSNSTVFYLSDLKRYIGLHSKELAHRDLSSPIVRKQLVTAMVRQQLALSFAISSHVDKRPETRCEMVRAYQTAMIEGLKESVFRPSRSQMEQYYRDHAAEFQGPPTLIGNKVVALSTASANAYYEQLLKHGRFDHLAQLRTAMALLVENNLRTRN